jgi:MFS family permease
MPPSETAATLTDSRTAWLRLVVSVMLSTIGGVGLWSIVVTLPTLEAEFGVTRAGASLPYTATMVAFAVGGLLMGWVADRVGIMIPLMVGAVMIGLGYALAAQATSLEQFILAQALLIGLLGASVTFGPLVADVSLWFARYRGIAVAIVASGNYLAGTIWPPILQYAVATYGWRTTYVGVGIFCVATMLPLALALRRRPALISAAEEAKADAARAALNASPTQVQALLVLAGLACCVAMAMPQVHIVAYCSDLGYGAARGAEMLSIMLGFGVISRIGSGFIADRIGAVRTLILGSLLQCITLLLYLPFDGLVSLYVVSALFGLSQGGIVPSYALIVRQFFPAREAGTRVSLVITTTVLGMALGGWMSGKIFDVTGSYQMAFFNGIAWNVLNLSIAIWLLRGVTRRTGTVAAAG